MGVAIDPQAGFDIPPPVGAAWVPYPIVVRQTIEGLSSRRIIDIPALPGAASKGPAASPDGTAVCVPGQPAGTPASCVRIDEVSAPQG